MNEKSLNLEKTTSSVLSVLLLIYDVTILIMMMINIKLMLDQTTLCTVGFRCSFGASRAYEGL